jgi:N-acetylneuraminate synthase/N,N'-diacetyllegionaminate synthase
MIGRNFEGKIGPLLIAEIGGNHEGNFEYAKKLTELAISTNVDFIKFQLYMGDTLVSKLENPQRNEHFKKFELTQKQHIYLAQMIHEAGIGYMASVWDEQMMEWIDPYMPIYKIGSGDLTAYPMLKAIAQKRKPIIISTGLSNEKEVLEAIDYIQGLDPIYKDPNFLAVLQCTSMYPINDSDANLSVIKRLKEITGLTVGYSDHTIGMQAMLYAYLLDAEIFEFHFTDAREGKEFRDHKVSLTTEEVLVFKDEIKRIQTLKGNNIKKPLPIEKENKHEISFRRAVYPLVDIKKGTVLTKDNLTCLRPNHGIDAREFESLLGRESLVDLKKHQKLEWKFIQ